MKLINLCFLIVVSTIYSTTLISQVNKTTKSDPNIPLFEVKNDLGQTVFAVYPGGVHIFVDDTPLKAAGGGFTVGRLSTGKAGVGDILSVSPNNVNIIIDDGTAGKAAGGGFAVGRLSTGKAAGDTVNFLRVTPDSTRIYTSETSDKGFAVGKLNGLASGADNFMHLNESNYFIGHNSGTKTSGLYNLFLGFESGFSNTTGFSNTFLGYKSGYTNTSGTNNVFLGSHSGYSVTTGLNNVFIGDSTGFESTNADYNVFIGEAAGKGNTSGNYNTLIGFQAGYNTGGSSYTTAIGYQAGYSLSNWQAGTYIGYEAGKFNTGRTNVFVGSDAGRSFTSGQDNVCVGKGAGGSNDSPFVPATGARNVFLGWYTGYKCGSAASDNVIVGAQGFGSNITGSNNVLLGSYAGNASGSGTGNVFIGYSTGSNETGNNKLYIDNSNTASPLIYGDFSLDRLAFNGNIGVRRTAYSNASLAVSPGGQSYGIYVDGGSTSYAVYLNGSAYATGVWNSSDQRWKQNITDIINPLEKVMKLRGTTFEWNLKKYPNNGFDKGIQYGLIAQEVEKVLPELVKENAEGFKAVAYDKLTAILIEAVKEQQKEIESLQDKNTRINELEKENKLLKERISKVDKLEKELEYLKKMTNKLLEKGIDNN